VVRPSPVLASSDSLEQGRALSWNNLVSEQQQAGSPDAPPPPEPGGKAGKRKKSTLARWRAIARTFRPFALRHRGRFLRGTLAAMLVVGLRIALPWPLRSMMKPWFGHGEGWSSTLVASLPAWLPPPVAMACVFLALMIALGWADYRERQHFARFAIRMVRDVRAKAFKAALRAAPQEAASSGDLVARLIGDTARLKAGLQGFLVHVGTNGAMVLGITAVLLWLDATIGAIFAGAGAFLAATTALGAARSFRRALVVRSKEGKLAKYIDRAWRERQRAAKLKATNRSSASEEGSLTRVQGRHTWLAHGVLGLAVVCSAIVGTRAQAAGELAEGDLFMVLVYALLMRAPLVQITRQGVRSGKVMACAHRLGKLLRAGRMARRAERARAGPQPDPDPLV
jgi:ABC-type multidrug transport system fused ATPase/permease subunit